MRILVTVGCSPWGSARSTLAWRFARAALHGGDEVAVFFHDDGVYNALPGDLSDDGLESPQSCWQRLSAEQGVDMMLCPAATARRLPAARLEGLPASYQQVGLAGMLERMGRFERLVSF
jgi:sulfur relay (sulfurtransferase) complex TusBCD TusD component (DsrE family)